MSKIRTAVVGLRLGLTHVHAYHHHNDLCELTYVVDVNEEVASKIAAEFGCKYATDWTQIIDEVDAFSFATPHHLHYPMGMQAIAAGKHVLMEKPLANTEEQCLEMIRAAEEKGVTLMLAYVNRFRPVVLRLKEAIEKEEYGKPINANYWIEAYMPPKPGSWFAGIDTLGGGVLFSHGCHHIDVLQFVLGTPVEVAGLGTRAGTDWLEGEGTHHAILKFENGALGHLITSWGLRFKQTPARLHLHTTEGCYVMTTDKLEVITKEGRKTLYEPAEPVAPNSAAFLEVEHFLQCIQTGARPAIDGYEGLKSLRIIWSIYSHQGTKLNIG
ncbi:MAG: oxidoreductase domain protein [Paenibacillus sp.]|nr:oxidoreductase domain protein [Paenibacillus sp.]